MSTRILLTALLATALTMPALAQSETPAAAATAPAATVQGSEPAANTVSRDKDTLSVDFPDEDIKTILRNVADLFELNLVVPDTLTGKTSIKLRDVSWRQIFQVVLAPAGFTYVEEGNIIKVVSNESLQLEPTATDVLILNNAKAADILPTITGMIDTAVGGKILVDARSNALVITERPSRMGRIRQTIALLDKATDQVMIESKFVEVTDRDIHDIGVNWASLSGMELSAGSLSQTFSRGRNQDFSNGDSNTTNSSTAVTGPNTSSQSGTSTSSGTNTSSSTNTNTSITSSTAGTPPVTTVTTSGPNTSINSSTSTNGTLAAPNTSAFGSTSASQSLASSLNSAMNGLSSLTNGGSTSRLASAVFSASDFKVILTALKTQNNTKIVSNPTIVTLNNSEATLNIGSEFPVPNYTYNSERGSFEVSGFIYKPIGVILKVTPQVNAQGLIRLNLEPEVSQQNGNTTFGGANIPIVATRKVKTQVSLKDGYTAGIGGLIQANQNHGNTKVPVLGSIPGLGRLFSSRSVNDQTTNLLIFITARTVNSDGAAPSAVFQASALEAVGMSEMAKK